MQQDFISPLYFRFATSNESEKKNFAKSVKDWWDLPESFDPNDAKKYSRSWFAWANTLFGGLIVSLAERKPYLLFPV